MTLPLPKQTNPTSSTKSIITPTIPTSPPFVCKATEKKNATKGQGGANGKGKCKAASTEKQPTATATPTMPIPVSGVSPSAPPSSYGAYAYPQYPKSLSVPLLYALPIRHDTLSLSSSPSAYTIRLETKAILQIFHISSGFIYIQLYLHQRQRRENGGK